jgi:hypothetical protein
MPDLYTVLVLPLGFFIPALTALFVIPSERGSRTITGGTWAFSTALWFAALGIASISPERWGWAIVWGSLLAGLLLISSWVGFYRMGKR